MGIGETQTNSTHYVLVGGVYHLLTVNIAGVSLSDESYSQEQLDAIVGSNSTYADSVTIEPEENDYAEVTLQDTTLTVTGGKATSIPVTIKLKSTNGGAEAIIKITVVGPVDYSELNVGDYVNNYPVYYNNVGTYNKGSSNFPKDEYNGWRILSIDTTNEIVRLISAGVPLNYKHSSNSSASVTALTSNFFSTPITSSTITDFNFYNSGFKGSETGTNVTDINTVKSLFVNKFTALYENGNPKVQSMTKADVDKAVGYKITGGSYLGGNDLLAVPCRDASGKYSVTFMATEGNWDGESLFYIQSTRQCVL